MPSSELAANTRHARDTLDNIHETYKRSKSSKDGRASLRSVADDPMVFVQLAKLWQTESLEKAVSAYQTAIEIHSRLRAGQDEGDSDRHALTGLKMSNNLATLYMLQGNVDDAMQMYEQVVASLGQPEGTARENFRSTLLYNLGRAYEDSNDVVRASEAYRSLLEAHPEYVNGKPVLVNWCLLLTRFRSQDSIVESGAYAGSCRRGGSAFEGDQYEPFVRYRIPLLCLSLYALAGEVGRIIEIRHNDEALSSR